MSARVLACSALALLLLGVVALSVGSVRLDSLTVDEPEHITTGMIKLTAGRLDFFREQPPLMDSVFAIPLVLHGYLLPAGFELEGYPWSIGRERLYQSTLDVHRVVLDVRLLTIALFVALVLTVFWFVRRETGSEMWALAGAALTGLCPNVMAHGRLITVDLPATLFCFAAAALFLTLLEKPSRPRAALFGVAVAAALMTKASANILAPWLVIVLVIAFRRIEDRRKFAAVIGIAIAAAVVFAELAVNLEASEAFIREAHPAMARMPLLRVGLPFVEYVENIRAIQTWYAGGHTMPQFFLGQYSYTGWPAYYPVAFLLKTTIPAILIIVIAAVMAGTRRDSRPLSVIACGAFVLLFLIAAARGNLDLGIRYVLPIYPFLYAGAAIALSKVKVLGPRASGLGWVVAVLLAWHVAENLASYPGYISYFNELIGSRRNADKFLIDSNLDWGQDLRRLDLWCRDNQVSRITIHYFGGAVVEYEMSSARPIVRQRIGPDLLPKGYFALSRHYYRVSFAPRAWGLDYDAYLEASRARYVTTVGGSIYVYRVE